jgi:hypothetical protein
MVLTLVSWFASPALQLIFCWNEREGVLEFKDVVVQPGRPWTESA